MKTYPLQNDQHQLHAFEISIPFRGRLGVYRIIEMIPNVKLLRKPKFLSGFRGEDVFCEFEINNKQFAIEEPFGDNSRYLIGSNPPGYCPESEFIEQAFKDAQSKKNITMQTNQDSQKLRRFALHLLAFDYLRR